MLQREVRIQSLFSMCHWGMNVMTDVHIFVWRENERVDYSIHTSMKRQKYQFSNGEACMTLIEHVHDSKRFIPSTQVIYKNCTI